MILPLLVFPDATLSLSDQLNRLRTPSSLVREREREKERGGGERERGRERGKEREREREVK